jgi:hypothetical protein
MANLITQKQKKEIKIEYYTRLASVSVLILALLSIFFLAYIVPYYISVKEKDLIVAEQFKSVISAENKENVGESVTRVVNQTLDELKSIELYSRDGLVPSVYLNKIIENKNTGISITRLSFSVPKKGQAQLVVNGISKSREGLVTFIDNLKFKAGFPSVESPISDFARDGEISFTINIKTAI